MTPPNRAAKSTLTIVFSLTLLFMIVEIIVGLISNSLALLADAGHMLSDVFSLGLSVFAIVIAQQPKNAKYTFGYYRAEILAALFNGLSLILISIYIIYEAFKRIAQSNPVLGVPMLIASIGGLLVNFYGLWALKDHSHNNLNVSSAFYHISADLLGSIAAIVAAILIIITSNPLWDVIVSVVITVLIMSSGVKIIRTAIDILMQASPDSVDSDEIYNTIKSVDEVDEVHDLHIWSIDQRRTMLTAHVVVQESLCQHDQQSIMRVINEKLSKSHNINHSTIQMEYPDIIVETEDCGC